MIIILFIIIIFFIYITDFPSCDASKQLEPLIRQVYRWYIASTQDNHPIIKVLHANYAVGYIGAIRSIATSQEVLILTGLDLDELEEAATKQQDMALVQLGKICPQALPSDKIYQKYVKSLIKFDKKTN